MVALTFDAGANGNGLPKILAALDRSHVPATFFITGGFADHNPGAVRSIVTRGYRLGNHAASHPQFTKLSDEEIRHEVTEAEHEIRGVSGASTRPLFRFPYGDRNSRTIGAVNGLGYIPVRWTVDTLGWQGTTGGRSASSVTKRVLDDAQPGEIVLMHIGSNPDDGSTLDADALSGVIAALGQRGYSFVTLDALVC